MDTHFAPVEKAGEEDFNAEIEIVSKNPVMSGLLHSISGLLAILNEHRQIIALNDSFMQMLGIDDPGQALGLRPGEALSCIHADDEPGGCGTGIFCSTCGAAIAIVSSLGLDKPVERICALSANRDRKQMDMALLVRSHPIEINKKRFLLLFLQDITHQQQRAALERTFFHDVNNILSMLLGASELLVEEYPSDLARTINQATTRLINEVSIQRCLLKGGSEDYVPMLYDFATGQILKELKSFFSNHPVSKGKNIKYAESYPDISIKTDISLMLRVLCNMVINALEATPESGEIRVWADQKNDRLCFHVWNAREIPKDTANRIFQRNFSTKDQAGRGIGTYSMKLFGEKILGGQVSFVTSKVEGTIFKFSSPI